MTCVQIKAAGLLIPFCPFLFKQQLNMIQSELTLKERTKSKDITEVTIVSGVCDPNN